MTSRMMSPTWSTNLAHALSLLPADSANRSAAVLTEVPPRPTTTTSTAPVPSGTVTVIVWSDSMRVLVALAFPSLTFPAAGKPVPVIVTVSSDLPLDGEMPVTVGSRESVSERRLHRRREARHPLLGHFP